MGFGSRFKKVTKKAYSQVEGSAKRGAKGIEKAAKGSAQATQGAIDIAQGGNSDRFDRGVDRTAQGFYDTGVELLDPFNFAPELRRGYGDGTPTADPLASISNDFIGEGFQEASATGLSPQVGDKSGLEGLKIKRKSQSGKIKQIGTAGKGGGS